MNVSFTVFGVPAPQGSKSKWGTEDNPRTRPWRAAVTAEAALAMGDNPPLNGPVSLNVVFVFPRPKSHYRTGRHSAEVKSNAPEFVSSKPDLDKLVRAIGDALTGVVLRDDSQIAYLTASKQYGETAHAYIGVKETG